MKRFNQFTDKFSRFLQLLAVVAMTILGIYLIIVLFFELVIKYFKRLYQIYMNGVIQKCLVIVRQNSNNYEALCHSLRLFYSTQAS